jgi:colanic acid biosynthesis glycosyl transferase WcaI
MRILLYGINYWPELTGVGKFTAEMAEWLVEQGHDVRMVTSAPYYPAWKIAAGYSNWRYSSEEQRGVKILRCPMYVPEQLSGLKRLLHLASFGLMTTPVILWQTMFWKPDVVINFAPTLFSSPSAVVASRLGGCPAWLHIQDFEVDAAFNLNMLKWEWLKRTALFLEKLILQRFSAVSTITCRMHEKLLKKGVAQNRAVLFPNWVDTDQIFPLSRPSVLRPELGIAPDRVVALYSGTMGAKQGLETLIEAARAIPEVMFVLCGQGAMVENLRQQSGGLANVRFLPLQPLEKLNELLNLADIHLLPQKRDAADLVMPSKITGMFASGRPVVATADPGTQLHLTILEHGLCPHPEDTASFIRAIRQLANHEPDRRALGRAARLYAEQHWAKETVLNGFLTNVRRRSAA